MIDSRPYIERALDAFSQLMNVLFWFGGNPNESISGRAWRLRKYNLIKIINKIFFWQDNHCRKAYINDVVRSARYAKESRR